jgi:hypothetical protein
MFSDDNNNKNVKANHNSGSSSSGGCSNNNNDNNSLLHFCVLHQQPNGQMANVKSKVKVGLPLLSMQVPRKL